MRVKTVAFMVLLIFTASAFAITSATLLIAENPDIDTTPVDFGGGPVQPCDPIGGGPGPGGDN